MDAWADSGPIPACGLPRTARRTAPPARCPPPQGGQICKQVPVWVSELPVMQTDRYDKRRRLTGKPVGAWWGVALAEWVELGGGHCHRLDHRGDPRTGRGHRDDKGDDRHGKRRREAGVGGVGVELRGVGLRPRRQPPRGELYGRRHCQAGRVRHGARAAHQLCCGQLLWAAQKYLESGAPTVSPPRY